MDAPTPATASVAMGAVAIAHDLATRVFGPLADAVGDNLKSWYEEKCGRNMAATVERAQAMLLRAGQEPAAVEPKRLLGILAGASIEDNPELRERWAALLANAAGTNPDTVHPAFSGILSDLTAFDARVLERLAQGTTPHGEQPRGTARERVALFVGEPDRTRVDVALDNLSRLQLIRIGQHAKWGGIPGLVGPDDWITTTSFGEQFLNACRPPQSDAPAVA